MREKVQLIAATICLLVILFLFYPFQTIVMAISIAIAVLIIKQIPRANFYTNDKVFSNQTIDSRKRALQAASIYLAPYDNIWANLRLTNKYITLRLNSSGTRIYAKELVNQKRTLDVVHSKIHSISQLWELLCYRFDNQLTFDGLTEILEKFSVVSNIKDNNPSNQTDSNTIKNISNSKEIKIEQNITQNTIDINNATEREIAKLPGISIILAKKIIKKRNEINGFKTVDDFLKFTKLNHHAVGQIKSLIIISDIKTDLSKQKTEERRIDL